MPISKAKSSKLSLQDIAHIGPGTPAGNWFRRYWVAVSRSEDLKDIPLGTRILGEDLVLFRDGEGKIGLLGMHCSHRGTSLEYGDIEVNGLRCPYHGWTYDLNGALLGVPYPTGYNGVFDKKANGLRAPCANPD
jgi:phenylpropionate dioxygenase-like ring-hydroxylating dioxygenase large terminal subunit